MKRITLTTNGRRTGEPRAVTLYAFDDADRLVVVGSRGGSARDPGWVLNLRAQPQATVGRGLYARRVNAREVDGDEYHRLWRLVVAEFPLYETYRRRTARTIPLFLLEPLSG
jgi:F420H(2)-dependent quinone reductase